MQEPTSASGTAGGSETAWEAQKSLAGAGKARAGLGELDAQHRALLGKLKEAVRGEDFPEGDGETGSFRLDEGTLLRFMNARDFDLAQATAMLQAHLRMRSKFRPHELRVTDPRFGNTYGRNDGNAYWNFCGVVELEGVKSTLEVVNVKHYHPRLYASTDEYVHNVLVMRELFTRVNMAMGVANTIYIFDLAGWTLREHGHPSTISHLRQLLDVVQTSYPETLRMAFVVNQPIVFKWTWALIAPFMDERTRSKITWLNSPKDLALWLPPDHLPRSLAGTAESFPSIEEMDRMGRR